MPETRYWSDGAARQGLLEQGRAVLAEHPDVVIVATGGLASIFADDLKVLRAVDPGLTLEGLRLIWERNRR